MHNQFFRETGEEASTLRLRIISFFNTELRVRGMRLQYYSARLFFSSGRASHAEACQAFFGLCVHWC